MCGTVMRGADALPGSKATSRAKGSHRKLGDLGSDRNGVCRYRPASGYVSPSNFGDRPVIERREFPEGCLHSLPAPVLGLGINLDEQRDHLVEGRGRGFLGRLDWRVQPELNVLQYQSCGFPSLTELDGGVGTVVWRTWRPSTLPTANQLFVPPTDTRIPNPGRRRSRTS